MDLEPRMHQDSIEIAASPEAIYDLVSDVARTGEWSPVCKRSWWDEGGGPHVGARFTGRNETSEHTWETTSTVTAAEAGRAFAWEVGKGFVRWGYRIEPLDGRTRLTESWTFTTAGQEYFVAVFGDAAPARIDGATRTAHDGIRATLEAIKRIAEAAERADGALLGND
ncbi:SRPBCC family protein [Nocardia vaccinii]|uniref:SRPBCC family protein n=1 Tax=Nocardia vaccinii TaxID=1822 RepID=UPI0009FBBD29|nr:SRPBCC family protein [Nocardia vaccinii]